MTPLQEPDKARLIKLAALIALGGNLSLGALKIGFGVYTGSLAVVGDGIDSLMDALLAVMALLVSLVIARPADPEHPWGHGRAETVATALLSFSLFFAGGQLILNAGKQLLSGGETEIPPVLALGITLISIVGKLLLAWSQYLFGKKADSAMLRANAKNMASDVILSAGVLLGLGLSLVLGIGLIDALTAVLVGLWVIKSAIEIFIEANLELMDGNPGKESYQAVFDAVHSVEGAGNPHRTRMRRIAGRWDIDLDIEVDPQLSVREAHRIASQVEKAIKARVEGVYDIMVHVEPIGDSKKQKDEGYGLREDEG